MREILATSIRAHLEFSFVGKLNRGLLHSPKLFNSKMKIHLWSSKQLVSTSFTLKYIYIFLNYLNLNSKIYISLTQLCYASTKENNSFEVRLMSQGINSQAHSKIIAQCSAGSSMLGNDVTCYTSIAQVLTVIYFKLMASLHNLIFKIRCCKLAIVCFCNKWKRTGLL